MGARGAAVRARVEVATVAAVRAVAVKEEGEEGKALVAGARAWAAVVREAAPTVGCMSRSSTSCTGPG